MPVEKVDRHIFPSGDDVTICELQISTGALAKKLCVAVDEWKEDGLGEARGVFLRLTTGRVIFVRELTYTIETGRCSGPFIHVDAGEASTLGYQHIWNEIRSELGLGPSDIGRGVIDELAWQAEAARYTRAAADYRRNKRK